MVRSPLKIVQNDISDINLYRIASLGCLPAAEWVIFRNSQYIGKKKEKIQEYVRNLRQLYKKRNISGLELNYSLDDLNYNELLKWHPVLLELPLRCLVNPINGESLNRKILSCKDKKILKDLTLPIRLKSLKLDREGLTSSELNKIITSIVLLNWSLRSRSSLRPRRDFLNYFVEDKIFLDENNNELERILRKIDPSQDIQKDKLEFILRYGTREMIWFVSNLSKSNLNGLSRSYYISQEKFKNSILEHLSDILPAYIILNEQNLDMILQVEKLSLLGYTDYKYLRLFDPEILSFIVDRRNQNTLSSLY